MEEIQADEYARTKHDGIIRIREIKQEKVFETYYEMGQSYSHSEDKIFIYYKDDDRRISIDDIVKHSHNIIDLIEVGDILEIEVDNETIIVGFKDDNVGFYNELLDKVKRKEIKILKISTHEQFTQNCYEVKE